MNNANESDKQLFMPRIKRVAGVIFASALLLGGLYVAGSFPGSKREDDLRVVDGGPSRALPVNTLVAEFTASYRQQRTLNGIVKARRAGDLSFSRSGKIQKILVDKGDRVSAGDLLAEIDTSQLTQQKEQLENASSRAQEKLSQLIADAKFRSMESIRAEVQSLQTQIDQLRDEIKESGDANTAARQQRLSDTQNRLDAVEATSRDPQVAEQRRVIGDLSEQIAQLDIEIEAKNLRAPYDGVIANRYVSDGMLVSPSVPIMRLVERDALEVWVGMPADSIDELPVGNTNTIFIGDRGFDATVSAKFPELDQTARTQTVVFSLSESASAEVMPGEIARLELSRQVDEPGFWLPITSLTREARGLWSVYELVWNEDGDQIVSRRYVEVIHVQGEQARVRGTLDDGALIIAEGTHRVVPGQKVTAVRTAQNLVTETGGTTGQEMGFSDLDRAP